MGNCGVLHEISSLEGKGFVEMTGIDAETSKDIHDVITGQGGRYLEAQIQGNKDDADKGNLVVLGAGDRTLFDECQSCFKAMGRTAFYLGEIGYAAKINSILQVDIWEIIFLKICLKVESFVTCCAHWACAVMPVFLNSLYLPFME